MCVKKEVWVLPPSDALLLPVNMVSAAKRLQSGIFNLVLRLWVCLIADPTCSSASSHVGTEAAASCVPPSPSGFQHNWPCLEI